AALQHCELPATIHTQPRNPHIAWDELPVRVVDERRAWTPGPGQLRRAGVSGFGLSGTNAHVILEEAPAVESSRVLERLAPAVVPLGVSARNVAALGLQAQRVRARLLEGGNDGLVDIAYSL